MKHRYFLLLAGIGIVPFAPAEARELWTKQQASAWYAQLPWLVGANYVPATAINQLEMWQEGSFDPATIEREFGWAQGLGMNTMRVFLHNLLWEQDAKGFKRRLDQFLGIAAKHKIRPMLVLLDSCWDPDPKLGPQHPPVPGVHNSGWVQAPGRVRLGDKTQYGKLKDYVADLVATFAKDSRILAWDVWNEPDNPGGGSYALQVDKAQLVEGLIDDVFRWARAQNPVQPLTSGVWQHDDWSPAALSTMERRQLTQSDVISFHDYSWPETFGRRVQQLTSYGRPILCTEYMARGNGSTFDGSLPIGKTYGVAMINWGFVDGKTQTRLPWDSWQRPYTSGEPPIWFHEILRGDGTPYRPAEVDFIRRMSAAPKGVVAPLPYTH